MTEDEILFELKVANKYLSIRNRCKEKGIPFGLTLLGVKNLLKAKRCFYTGKPFTSRDALTVERIIPEKGYVTGNVVAVRLKVNQAKADISPEDIILMAEKLKKLGL